LNWAWLVYLEGWNGFRYVAFVDGSFLSIMRWHIFIVSNSEVLLHRVSIFGHKTRGGFCGCYLRRSGCDTTAK